MLKNINLIIIIIFIPISLYAQEELKLWFDEMSNEFVDIVEEDNKSNLEQNLTKFIENRFAINSISMSLIGNLQKKNSKTTLNRYKKSFLTHLTKTLYNLLERYDGQIITLNQIKQDSNGYLIYSNIDYKDKKYSIIWRIAYINNKPLILDVIIENTSFYVTKKSEFSKILRAKGNLLDLINTLDKVTFNK